MKEIFGWFFDRYDSLTRALPALLVVLPLLVPLVCVYGIRNSVQSNIMYFFVVYGVIYLFANWIRSSGKKLEERLLNKWGGMPTTIALRHRDKHFDRISKQRYHSALTSKLGIVLPTAQEELDSPEDADEIYFAAVRSLRERTRSKKELLLNENIAYGFKRNMLAVKPIGVIFCFLGAICALWIGGVLQTSPLCFEYMNFKHFGFEATLTLVFSVLLLLAWLLYFDQETLRKQGFFYAERLFECLSSDLE